MDGTLRKGIEQLAVLISDEAHYSGVLDNIGTKLRMGIVLAESGLPLATTALVLARQAQRELAATEPGKRISVAWHVLRGRPAVYRATIEGRVVLDDETLAVDTILMPAATLSFTDGRKRHVRVMDE